MQYNIFCDESCHLEFDKSPVMVLGAVSCADNEKASIFSDIRNIKTKHGLSSHFEIKWTKVSESKIDFYIDIINYFWNSDVLSYRGLIATGKDRLDHQAYNGGDYDLWYYKMYFCMLDAIIRPDHQYRIFIDIKDTHGGKRVQKLHEVLCNNRYDFHHDVISSISQINSRESEILQIADLISGAIAFYNRGMYCLANANPGKKQIVDELLTHKPLDSTTPLLESKFNLFVWKPRSDNGGKRP